MRSIPFGIIVLLGLWGWGRTMAQTVMVSGENPAYAGKSIQVSIPGNPFLDIPSYSETVICDSKGIFSLEFAVETGTIARFATGIYNSSLYVEPDSQYEIQLPPLRELAYSERISPYFEPLNILLKTMGNPQDVNHLIYRFDSLFSNLNEELIRSRRIEGKPLADSMIGLLESEFESGIYPWFDDYRKYKSGILKLNEGRTGLGTVSHDFLGPNVRETHPAFMELFGAMFKDFLVYYDRTSEGKGIVYQINRAHNLDSLRNIISSHAAITNDTLCDLLLLQELPSLFYRGNFHREAILILLDSMESDPVNPAYSLYSKQIRARLSSLLTGNSPPPFSLEDIRGKEWSLADFKGKYTYLMFCTPDHYGCMMEYPFLKSYFEKHSSYLEVVSVMVAESHEKAMDFMKKNDYPWKALYYGDNDKLLDDYMVKAFPVAYLIGPDGTLILSPAPLPTDGFEQQLFRIMRSRGDI
jgi:hypothetical protein